MNDVLRPLAAGFTAVILALPSLAFSKQPQIMEQVDENRCTLIKQEECKTTKRKADKHCGKWHKDEAEALGANAVVLTGSISSERKRPKIDGTMDVITTTQITADYFSCEMGALSNSGAQTTQAAAVPAKTIEQRLIRLQQLKDKGLITEAEYQQKREQILNEL